MKRRLNILCVLVVLVLGYSVLETAYYLGEGFAAGLEMTRTTEGLDRAKNMKAISLVPADFTQFTDSVYNEKSGSYVPALYGQLIVSVPMQTGWGSMMFVSLVQILGIVASVVGIILFIKLIVSINRSLIFSWRNVRRLRWLGGALLLHYLCMLVPLVMAGWQVREVFALRGYEIHQSDLVSAITLVLAIVSFIVAEVFAIGLKMKEEQDLTI